jgi:hypothetical protein
VWARLPSFTSFVLSVKVERVGALAGPAVFGRDRADFDLGLVFFFAFALAATPDFLFDFFMVPIP